MDRRWVVMSDEDYHSGDNRSLSDDISSNEMDSSDDHVVYHTDRKSKSKFHNEKEHAIGNKRSIAEVTSSDLNKAIEHLASLHDVSLDHLGLDQELSRCYHLVKWVDSVWAGTSAHKELDKIIGQQFRPTEVKQYTIGSFLFGCYQITYGDIPRDCSPLCVGQVDSKQLCPQQIWIQKENDGKNRFIRVKSEDSDKGYIYLNDNFKGFTLSEINLLKESRLKEAKLLQTKRGKHFVFYPMTNIDELPVINVKKNWINFTGSNQIDDGDDNNFIWHAIVLFLFLIIILVIISCVSSSHKKRR